MTKKKSRTTKSMAPYKNASLPVEKRVKDLLVRMTIEEKIYQLHAFLFCHIMFPGIWFFDKPLKQRIKHAKTFQVESVLNWYTVKQPNDFTESMIFDKAVDDIEVGIN